MKALVLCAALLALSPLAIPQDADPAKHLTVAPANGAHPVRLSAESIERGAEYPSTVQLKGNVEIRTDVCTPSGKHRDMICEGEMVLRADAAEFHEADGRVEAHGNVSFIPLERRAARK